MEHLPNEIKDLICSFVSRDDLKSLRLTCISTRDSATALYFQTFNLFPFEESFRIINENPRIREHVRCLRYVSRLLPDVEVYEEYITFVGQNMGMREQNLPQFHAKYTKAQLEDAFEMCCWYRESQFQVLEHGKELELLTDLFAKLPQLREIQLVPGREYSEYNPETKEFNESISDAKDFHIIAQETLVNPCPSFLADILGDYRVDVPEAVYERQLRFLLAAAKRSGGKMEKFVAEQINWCYFHDMEMNQVQDYLGSLRHLVVSFDGIDIMDTKSLRKGVRRLREVICAPHDLETLHVSFGYIDSSFDYMDVDGDERNLISLARIFDDSTSQKPKRWPNLRDLVLEGISTQVEDLLDFLNAHSATLRLLELNTIELYGDLEYDSPTDSWIAPSFKTVFKGIQKSLKLKHVRLMGVFNNFEDETWNINEELPCCQRGGFHTDCLKGRVENFIANKGPWDFEEMLDKDKGDESWQWLP